MTAPTRTRTYLWRTDAASGVLRAESMDDAIARLVAEAEWPTPHHVRDGSWGYVRDAESHEQQSIGVIP